MRIDNRPVCVISDNDSDMSIVGNVVDTLKSNNRQYDSISFRKMVLVHCHSREDVIKLARTYVKLT